MSFKEDSGNLNDFSLEYTDFQASVGHSNGEV